MVNIEGHEFEQVTVRSAFYRKAMHYEQKLIGILKKIGVPEDDIDIKIEKNAMQKIQASIAWYMWDVNLFYSYTRFKFVENLGMVTKVIEYFVYQLEKGEITKEKFIALFKEDYDISERRKHAREVLGVDEDSTNFDEIHAKYKKLAKEHHPDMPNGNTEKFKEINTAHKLLKKEMNEK